MSNSFPIKINHTIPNLPTKLTELEALTKNTLESTINSLPQNVNDKTFVNNVEITGQQYLTSATKKTFSSNPNLNNVDLASITGDKNKISTFKGDDFILSKGASTQIDSGTGNDTVIISGNNNIKTYLNEGDDLLIALGNQNEIGSKNIAKYNEGNDSIAINGDKNKIYTGGGDDTVLLTGEKSFLDTGSGDDQVDLSGYKNTINTYKGNDLVSVNGTYNQINTDRGDDSVQVKGDSNLIKTGIGDDAISIFGKNNKLFAGDGNDIVTIDNLTENNISYTPNGGSIDLGNGDDQVILNSVSGTFNINGGSGTNSIKFNNIDLNQYSGSFQNKVLKLFKTDGSGETLTVNLLNIQSIEFAGNNVIPLNNLTSIQGKTIQFNSLANTTKVVNSDGSSNVLQLDFNYGKVTSVAQTGQDQFNLNYVNSSNVSKSVSLKGIYHLKTTDGFTINLTQTPNLKAIDSDISSFLTTTTRVLGSIYNTKIFDPLSSETYNFNLDINKDVVLALDSGNPNQLMAYNASKLVIETYGNSTAITSGIADGTILTNADNKTNVADFSQIKTGNIHRIERLKYRNAESYQGVLFSPTSPYFSTLPSSLSQDVTLNFDGVSDIDTLVNAFNIANPNSTITHNGVGTDILSNGSVSLNNVQDVSNQYRVIFNDGIEKKITLDGYNFVKTAEGHEIHIESFLDSLKNGLDKELTNIDPTDPNYNVAQHDGLKNAQFARGSYNFLSSLGDANKLDALTSLGSATYPLLKTSNQTSFPISNVISTPAPITPTNADLIDGNTATFFSTAKKSNLDSENFILDLGAPTKFSKVQLEPRDDFNGLFPNSFDIYAGDDVNNLVSLGTITAAQAQSGYILPTPNTSQFIKFVFSNKELSNTNEFYAEIGNVTISDLVEINNPATVYSFSSESAPNVATRAVDNNLNLYWRTVNTGVQSTEILTLDLGSSKPVSKVGITARAGNSTYFPNDFDIYVGDDPLNLNLAASITNYTTILNNPTSNDFSFPELTGQYVQLRAKNRLNGGSYSLRIAEVDVFDSLSTYATLPVSIDSVSTSESLNSSSDASHLLDNDINTFFSSPVNLAPTSHSITLDLGSSNSITDLSFLARPGYENLFPNIDNIYVSDNPIPTTSVTGLSLGPTSATFDPIAGRYIKLDFTSQQNGTTGNYYSQISSVLPSEFNATISDQLSVKALATSLQDSLTFLAKEPDYIIDDATKGLFSLRIASILRNRPDVIDKIKNSGLTIEFTSEPIIPNGATNAEGLATFTQGSNKSYEIQMTADSFFSGAYDNQDGQAVDIHETIHVLDYLDGTADGNLVLFNGAEKLEFGSARSNLFAPLSTPLPPLGEGLLYSSGVDNPTRIANALDQGYSNSKEFLAYASTAFFERADELVALGPDGQSIYNKLSNYFGLVTNVVDPNVNVFTNIPPVY